MVGASTMSMPLPRASAPRAAASSRTSSLSQVAPRADGQGTLADGFRSSLVMPRIPAGPSDMTIGRSPSPGAPKVRQLSAPVSRRTFSSTGSAATRLRSAVASVDVVIKVLASGPRAQDFGVRCRMVSSMYGVFGTGFMYGLLADGQPV